MGFACEIKTPRPLKRIHDPMTPEVTEEELKAASYATLRAHATSESAKALVAKLSSMVEEHTIQAGLRKKKRKNTAGKLEYATGAFLADLLRPLDAEEPNGWVYRSLQAKSFTGGAVPRLTFEQLLDGLKGLAFLDHVLGHKVSGEPEDTMQYASRFRATPALLRFCREHGLEPTRVPDHFEFEYDLPKHPVELRARKLKNFFSSAEPIGKPMEFERTGFVEVMETSIRELNEFFAKQTLRGGLHQGYIRIFQNGDDPAFRWNKGGRFYSQPFVDSYQVMSAARRAEMTINGEPVAEIDIRASYLTIFMSLHQLQLDPTKDPYELPGLGPEHRPAVKAWMVATFGSAKPITRWPPRMLQKSPELRQHRVADITQPAFTKYPALRSWGERLNDRIYGWADLMWLESAVMFSTMLDLMREHHTPSLSVHDSLIVPASRAEVAREAIKARFHAQQKATPLLKINLPTYHQGEPRNQGGPRGDKGNKGTKGTKGTKEGVR
jgi:hypothetical protein